jgi:hypothetical protein
MSLLWDLAIVYLSLIEVLKARIGVGRGVYRVLVGNPEGKRPLGRPRGRWEDNIKANAGLLAIS